MFCPAGESLAVVLARELAHVQVGAVDVADCAVHRAINAAMDPDHTHNPGKVGALEEL